jgi:hypothetical protein
MPSTAVRVPAITHAQGEVPAAPVLPVMPAIVVIAVATALTTGTIDDRWHQPLASPWYALVSCFDYPHAAQQAPTPERPERAPPCHSRQMHRARPRSNQPPRPYELSEPKPSAALWSTQSTIRSGLQPQRPTWHFSSPSCSGAPGKSRQPPLKVRISSLLNIADAAQFRIYEKKCGTR